MWKKLIACALVCLIALTNFSKDALAYDGGASQPDITVAEYDPSVRVPNGSFYKPWITGIFQCLVNSENIPTLILDLSFETPYNQIGFGIVHSSGVMKLGGQVLDAEPRYTVSPFNARGFNYHGPFFSHVLYRVKGPKISAPTEASFDGIIQSLDLSGYLQGSASAMRHSEIVGVTTANDNFVPVPGNVPVVTCYPGPEDQELKGAFFTDNKYSRDLALMTASLIFAPYFNQPSGAGGQLTLDVLHDIAPGVVGVGTEEIVKDLPLGCRFFGTCP